MGARILKQPNGTYLRWSYNSDSPTHWNMTVEDYRNYRLELAKKEIERDIKELFDNHNVKNFDTFMKKEKHFVSNMTKEEFAEWLKAIGSKLTVNDFTFYEDLIENEDE